LVLAGPAGWIATEALKKSKSFSTLAALITKGIDKVAETELSDALAKVRALLAPQVRFLLSAKEQLGRLAGRSDEFKWLTRTVRWVEQEVETKKRLPPPADPPPGPLAEVTPPEPYAPDNAQNNEPGFDELLGASATQVRVSGTETTASVALHAAARRRTTANLQTEPMLAPVRIFLNLENVRGFDDAIAFNVYIDVPEGDDAADHPELNAGSIALAGVRKATMTDAGHAGDGLTLTLEITDVIGRLHQAGALNTDRLHVRLVPRQPIPDEARISIGRISVFRESP
jgi:hypothetical protein